MGSPKYKGGVHLGEEETSDSSSTPHSKGYVTGLRGVNAKSLPLIVPASAQRPLLRKQTLDIYKESSNAGALHCIAPETSSCICPPQTEIFRPLSLSLSH